MVTSALSKYDNLQIVHGNAFSYDLGQRDFNVCITSLPYSQSLKFVRWSAEKSGCVNRSIAIVQLEFANKLVSTPGNPSYRAISVVAPQISFESEVVYAWQ